MFLTATSTRILNTPGDSDLIEFLSEIEQVIPSSVLVDGEMGHQEAFRNIIQAVCAEIRTGIEVFPRLYALFVSLVTPIVLSIYILTYCLWKVGIEARSAKRLVDISITFKL